MRRGTRLVAIGLAVVACTPLAAVAESLTNPIPPGKMVYPYKDLPGVTAPHPAVDDNFKCHTAPGAVYFGRGLFGDTLPALGYVCDQNGVVSFSSRPPNRQFWQYNNLDQ